MKRKRRNVARVRGPVRVRVPAEPAKSLRSVILGVCGVGAAVSAPQYVLYLRENGIDVTVILSRGACQFVSEDVLRAFSRRRVFKSFFDVYEEEGVSVPHVELAERADAMLVLPASAAMLGRIANGIVDDLIAAVAVFSEKPVFVVPALYAGLEEKPAIRRNIDQLRADGIHVIECVDGPAIKVTSARRVGRTIPAIADIVRQMERVLSGDSGAETKARLPRRAPSRCLTSNSAPPDRAPLGSGSTRLSVNGLGAGSGISGQAPH